MDARAIETDRLILRRYTARDAFAHFGLLRDERVTAFLPLFPLSTLEEARAHLERRFLSCYRAADAGVRDELGFANDLRFAICLKHDPGEPIGFIKIDGAPAFDVGYALRRSRWHRGYAREALAALIEAARRLGYPYLTATHDELNPRSGSVMAACGMTFRYAYHERWQPKDIDVIFRMYQIDLVGGVETYPGYREQCGARWVG